jgi:hypothetical protein
VLTAAGTHLIGVMQVIDDANASSIRPDARLTGS